MGMIADRLRQQIAEMEVRHNATMLQAEQDLAECWEAFHQLEAAHEDLEALLEEC